MPRSPCPPSARIKHQPPLSHPRRSNSHKLNCTLMDFSPFGPSQSCITPLFGETFDIIKRCSIFLPSLSLHQLLGLASMDRINALLALDFPTQVAIGNDQFYLDSYFQIHQLREASRILAKALSIQSQISVCLKRHDALPSDNSALIVIQNLLTLYECVNNRRTSRENNLWAVLDNNPGHAVAKLRALMSKLSENSANFQGKLPFIQLRNFQTLGVGRWLDDEIINYFVKKWCSKSGTTVGFSTFFASKVLFQENDCVNPKDKVTTADERLVRGWYLDAVKGISNWDRVFIPINESKTHWYSARIDFHLKRIDIYDSLKDRYAGNRGKPVLLRRNAPLMMILMWLTEVLSRIRGEDIDLTSRSESDWVCDPHFKVCFQPNSFDCGVHLLWHLRHVLEFRQVLPSHGHGDESLGHLAFTNNMVGKCLRLAREMLDDIGLGLV
ncbi:hypothetical protein D9757_011998 [Collybiopsis confluens]|uniref:Ubiquitin-like protease family profile domain-containing protein n=1 Tax=Collybiopsis confluens TaxID=2823264 RepID=A0A8H5GRM1_9AGAR|nr:hypothetical protein D9757_011998 [Collybiopsis confluens]